MNGAGKQAWGWYPAGNVWVPIQVDANGKLIVNMSSIKLDDLGDVSVALPTDGYFLYWNAATSLWKCRALVDADIPATICRDSELAYHEALPDVHHAQAHTLTSHSTKAHSELTGVGSSDHHVRYADAEAVTAMGAKADANPLNHDRYTDAQAKAQAEAAKLDDHAAPDDNTDLNASTSKHGLVVKATAPAANTLNVVGIANGEAAYTDKTLFDATNPAVLGTAAPGTSLSAAHRDHVHTDPVPTHAALTTGVHAFDKSCRVKSAANQSIPNITFTKIAYTAEDWDTDAIHNIVTNNSRLTCKTAGLYFILATATWAAGGASDVRLLCVTLKNGYTKRIAQYSLSTNVEVNLSVSLFWNLAVNDYIESEVYQASGGNLNILYYDGFSPLFTMARIA